MINGINPALQSAMQSVGRTEEQRELRPEIGQSGKTATNTPAVEVSLQQTTQNPAQQAVQDYRALGQKAVLAAGQATESDGQNNLLQAQQQMRNQAYLATAVLKNGGL